MIKCNMEDWEQKQMLHVGCNFFVPLWEDASGILPKIATVVSIIGGCSISSKETETICMGKRYCPYWKVSRVHIDTVV